MPSPSVGAPLDRSRTLGLGLGAACLIGLFYPLMHQLVQIWMLDANYSHGFFILPVSLWLTWLALQNHPLPDKGDAILGGFTLAVGLGFHLLGVVLRLLPIEFLAILLVLRGVAVVLGGSAWANKFLFPTFFLGFLFPLPVALTTRTAVWLQDVIASVSAEVLGWFFLSFRRGNHIHLAGIAEPLYVAQECSGVRQIMAFVALAALVAYLGKTGWTRGLLLVALSVPVAIVTNVVRVLLMAFGLVAFGPSWLSTWLHDVPAIFTLPLGILMFFGLLWLVTPQMPAKEAS